MFTFYSELRAYVQLRNVLTILTIAFFSSISFAEGTRELRPTSSDEGYLQFHRSYNNFAQYGCLEEERLHITICNVGEVIYYGSKILGNTPDGMTWRLRAPDGTIYNEEGHPTANNETGFINSYNEAVNGPAALVGGGGYDAHAVVTNQVGDWYLEFNAQGRRKALEYTDITVADAPGGNAITGRVWSRAWCMTTESFGNAFNGTLYMYSDDQIVTALDFNGIRPYVYTITANRTGVDDTGDFNEDRKSQYGYQQYAQYRIFLNDPDVNCFPTGQFGQVTEDPTVTGCSEDKCINITVDREGTIQILIDLNGTDGYQPDTEDRILRADAVVGPNCVPWDSRDGFGNLVMDGVTIDLQIDFLNGITHLPMTDVERHYNGYTVSLVRPAGDQPRLFWDDTNIWNSQELNGCTNASGCHTWDVAQGNDNTINTWWYANIIEEEINTTQIVIDADANVNIPGKGADNDTTICENIGAFTLAGEGTGSITGILWTTDGSGTFSDATDPNSTYTPSAADYGNGMVRLTITTTGNAGGCPAVSDYMDVTLSPAPTITSTSPTTVCENNPSITLTSTQTIATGVEWIGGTGIFVPSRVVNNTTYTPSTTEIAAGSVTLTVQTTGNGVCNPESESMTITIEPAPIVSSGSAGPAQSVCDNNTLIQLNGSFSNANQITWSGGTGTFSDVNDPQSTYQPTTTEINNGTFTLTLTTDAPGTCNPESDDIDFTITPSPTVDAGAALTGCTNNDTVQLSGAFTIATGAQWTSNGTGTFIPNDTDMNAQYVLSANDLTQPSIDLTLTTTGNGLCNPVSDNVTITIATAPTVTITSTDPTVCENNSIVNACVNVVGSSGGVWSTDGGGTFSPNVSSTCIAYTPSTAEINANLAAIIYTADDIAGCNSVSDTLEITINPKPFILAGADQSICKNNPDVSVSGTLIIGDASEWIGGTGTFSNPVTDANNTYTPSQTELDQGFVDLVFQGTFATCNPEYDTLRVTFTDSPTLVLGPDQTVCANNADVSLSAAITTATGVTWTGSGSFDDANSLTPTYTPTSGEISGGTAQVIATTTGNGNCLSISDRTEITITPAPTADAGADQTVCYNNSRATITGSVTVATQGLWSGGTGRYISNANDLTLRYQPTRDERDAGSVTLTLCTVDNGNCNAECDDVLITIDPSPTITDFNNQRICGDESVTYNITVGNATGIEITGGTGVFNPDRTSTSFTYTPSAQEIIDGEVLLSASTTGNGLCNARNRNNRRVTIDPIPSVFAGNDLTICDGSTTVDLNGTSENVNNVVWSTSGNGSFSDRNSVVTVYTPSTNDLNNGSVTLTLLGRGIGRCDDVTDEITITFAEATTIIAGADQTVCTNSFPVQLNATGSPSTWSTSGTGTFSNVNDLASTYTPSDAEVTAGSVVLTVATIPTVDCPSVSDQLTINLLRGPEAIAGNDQIICANETVTLNGTVDNATGGLWTTDGGGSFDDPTNLNAIYTPSANDTSLTDTTSLYFYLSTTGVTPCSVDSDTLEVKLAPAPTVDAGADQTVCANEDVTLFGSVQNTSGVTWSGGTGTFSDPNNASTTYTPTASDTTAGTVTLTLTTTASTYCTAISDDITITFSPVPISNAGSDITVCADTAYVQVSGSATNASGGLWYTDGTGTFSLTNASLTTDYYFSTSDTALSEIKLWLETSSNGVCSPTADTITVSFSPIPDVDAGDDITTCADVASITLNGSLTIATQGIWTSNGTGTFDNVNAASPIYTPSTADRSLNTIMFTYTTVDHGLCKPYSDQVMVTLTTPPTVDAGFPLNVCANETAIQLGGSVTIAGGVLWTTDGTGTFDDDTSITPLYTPSSADTTNGSVMIRIASTDNGLCNSVSDSVEITFTSEPIVSVGNDITICADTSGVQLIASQQNTTGITWTTSGSGNFFASQFSDTVNYVPSAADTAVRSVQINLTSDAGICPSVSDSLTISILPQPYLDIIADFEVCADSTDLSLTSSVSNATGLTWTKSGTGMFSDSSSLTPTYQPSSIDTLAGAVTLTVTSTGNGICNAVSASTVVSFESSPILDAGLDQTLCAVNSGLALSPSEENTDGVYWTTSGTGVFGPDTLTANATYYPSADDTTARAVTLYLFSINNGYCAPTSDTLELNIQPLPVVNAGDDIAVCADTSTVTLLGTVTNANSGSWSLLSGSGIFSNASDPSTFYTPSTTDTTNGAVSVIFTSTGNGLCPAAQDTLEISIAPEITISAGVDQTECADAEFVILTGSSDNASYTEWSTSGTGTFSNINNMTTNYSLSDNDKGGSQLTFTLTAVDTVNGCKTKTDFIRIDLNPIPTIDAGNDLVVCNGIDSIPISGVVQNATGGRWTIESGTGSFSPTSDSIFTYYKPSAADFTAGSVDLRLYSTGNDLCLTYTDEINISFSPAPPISAGNDTTVCTTDLPFMLQGALNTGNWIGGLGTFNPDRSTSNALYQPDATEITAGSVTLFRETNNNGSCLTGRDTVVISFTDGPTVDAGTPIEACSNDDAIVLSGAFTVATGINWTTSGSGTFDDQTSTTASYSPSSSDINAGSVILNLETTGNGICGAQSDDVLITFRTAPTANAGTNRNLCADNPTLTLSGAFTNATGANWSGGTTANFSDVNDMSSTYTASASEISNGEVTIYLNTSGHPNCDPAIDSLIISIAPTPVVSVNNDTTVCKSNSDFQLSGDVQFATSGRWTTSGSGTFSPSDSSLNALYVPSQADFDNNNVTLTLTSEGNGLCNAVSNSFVLTFQDISTVTPDDQLITVCDNETNIALNATIANATGVIWESTGSGLFADSLSTTTTYSPSQADIDNSSVILLVSSTGNGACDTANSTVTINFETTPQVNAGFDVDVCATETEIQLTGSYTIAPSASWGTYNGTGTFSPDVNTLTAKYLPSTADTAQGFVNITLTTAVTECPAQIDTVMINLLGFPTVDAGDTLQLCDDTTAISLNGQITNAPGGVWSSAGDGFFSTSSTDVTGTYVLGSDDLAADFIGLTLENTGNNLCPKDNDVVIIAMTRQPEISISTPVSICENSADITLNATAENYSSVNWSTFTDGTFTNGTTLNPTYALGNTDRTNGYIDLTITANGNNTCNPVDEIVRVDVQLLPIVSAGPDISLCANNSINIYDGYMEYGNSFWTSTGTGTFSPSITDLEVTYTPSAADTASGSINIILNSFADAVCSSTSDTLVINFLPQPYITIVNDVLCDIADGVALQANVNNSNPGNWTTSGTGTFSPSSALYGTTYYPTLDDYNNGNVTLTFTTDNSLNCNEVSQPVVIDIEALPVSNAGPDQYICRNSDLTIGAEVYDNVSYEWFINNASVGTNANVTVNAANDINLVLVATDYKGCQTRDSMNVLVYDLPTFNLQDPFCFNDTLFLDSDPQNVPSVPGIFQWYKDDVLQSGQNTSIYYINDDGVYTISYSYQNCATTASSTVHPLPDIMTTDAIACTNEDVVLSVTEMTGATYNWELNGTSIGNSANSTTTAIQDTTKYYITVTDVNNCSSLDSMDVIGIEKPIIILNDTSACADVEITLISTPTNSIDYTIYSPIYSWSRDGSDLGVNSDSLIVNTDGAYIGMITIDQCISSDTSDVTFNPLPVSELPDEDLEFCEDDTVGIVLDAGASSQYFWEPTGDTTQTTLADREDMYFVTLTNQFECSTRDSIFVGMVCPPIIHIPTAFTPTVDGGDQTFKVFSKYVETFDLTIYNRWGEVIFHTTDINEGWDGMYLGEIMPVGTYPWVIRYTGKGDHAGEKIKDGRVTLLK